MSEAVKQRARRLVRDALKRGALVRPTQCARCGATPPPARDGRSQIHGHHADHGEPLAVEWICAVCHRIETPVSEDGGGISPGEMNGQARLSEELVMAIRASPDTRRVLAARYGVHPKTIQAAKNGKYWGHVSKGNHDDR